MFPPTQSFNLDVTAISGICGSVSIACWVVVFSPQVIEQFRRGSADGLSLQFIIVWLAGDIFNILGAVLQSVLPTMVILAVYYTLADIVLLGQCFYYRGFTWHDEIIPPSKQFTTVSIMNGEHLGEPNELTGLLAPADRERRPSVISADHLSPAVPLQDAFTPSPTPKPTTRLQAIIFNLTSVLMVCTAGVFGWWVSERSQSPHHSGPSIPKHPEALDFNLLGQIFGYLCAILYLSSRVPQILLNYRRKSTSGVSILFFLFACIGNLTYVLSILAYEPHCYHKNCVPGEAAQLYGKYVAVNASWLVGSLGTLLLDLGIFAQFFMYRERDGDEDEVLEEEESGVRERPLLDRGLSDV